jgi:spore germination protein KC
MKTKTKAILLAFIIIGSSILSGCWNYREIDDYSLIAGIAIDKGGEDNYEMLFEIIDVHEEGKKTQIESHLLKTTGDTLFDAVRNALGLTAPRLYFGHIAAIIISSEVAEEGLKEIIDIACRHPEMRFNIDILVSREKTAGEILDTEEITTDIQSIKIRDILEDSRYQPKIPRLEIRELLSDLMCEVACSFVPAIQIDNSMGTRISQISGSAVFMGDKLIGFLSGDETYYLNFVADKIKGGLIAIKDSPDKKGINVSLEILKSQTKIRPVYSNGELSINVQINTRAALEEQGPGMNWISENGINELEKIASEHLNNNIKRLVNKVQKDYGADVFKFGEAIYKNMPSMWKRIVNDWDDIFKDIRVDVNSEVEIVNSGLFRNIADKEEKR